MVGGSHEELKHSALSAETSHMGRLEYCPVLFGSEVGRDGGNQGATKNQNFHSLSAREANDPEPDG